MNRDSKRIKWLEEEAQRINGEVNLINMRLNGSQETGPGLGGRIQRIDITQKGLMRGMAGLVNFLADQGAINNADLEKYGIPIRIKGPAAGGKGIILPNGGFHPVQGA